MPVLSKQPVIYVVFKTNAGPTSTRFGGFITRLKRTGSMPNATYKCIALDELVFVINAAGQAHILNTEGQTQFEDADFVYFKSWEALPEAASMVVSYLTSKGIEYEDRAVAYAGIHKPSQAWKLWRAGAVVPPTMYAHTVPAESIIAAQLGQGPYLVKPAKGEKGKGIQRVHSYQEVVACIQPNPGAWVIQPFIQNDGDYRVMVYGYEVRGALYRQGVAGSIVNNTSQGGTSTFIQASMVPTKVAELAARAAYAVEYAVAGVDVLCDTAGRPYVLEVNQGSQIVTGHHTQEKMTAFAQYLQERLSTRFTRQKPNNRLEVIGRYTTVHLPELGVRNIFAKIDTGAYQSSIHATDIQEVANKNGPELHFTILEGHAKTDSAHARSSVAHEFKKVKIKNSFGQYQERYVVYTRISINGRMMKTGITLADRTNMVAPVLLGRRFLRGRYIVNVEIDRHARYR